MKRITGTYVDPNANGAGIPGFTEGDPGVQGATVVHADWLNHVQEEIALAIEAQGIALNPSVKNQLSTALAGGEITAPQLTAPVASWNPAGLAAARIVLASTDNVANFPRGLALGGRTARYIVNTGSIAFTLPHEDAGAAAPERFACPSNVNLVLEQGDATLVVYDATSSRWRVIGQVRTFGANVVVTGDVRASADLVAGDQVRLVEEVKYVDVANVATPKARSTYLQLVHGRLSSPALNWNYDGITDDQWDVSGASVGGGDFLVFPLRLPSQAEITGLEASYETTSVNYPTAAFTLRLRRLTPQPAAPTTIAADDFVQNPIADGFKTLSLSSFTNMPAAADRRVLPASRTFQALFGHSAMTTGTVSLHWLRVDWLDFGPIAHMQ